MTKVDLISFKKTNYMKSEKVISKKVSQNGRITIVTSVTNTSTVNKTGKYTVTAGLIKELSNLKKKPSPEQTN